MDILHKLLFGAEISLALILSSIALSVSIATVRALFGKKQAPFNYPADVPAAEAEAAAESYPRRSIVALDVFLNVVILFGNQGETMSTHAWRAMKAGKLWGKLMNWWLNGFQENHGPQAASGDLQRNAAEVSLLRKLLGV